MKKLSNILIINALYLILFQVSFAQNVVPFVRDEANIIGNSQALAPFYQKMKLINDSGKQVHILHIGDSHLQADFLTEQTRQLFNSEAARGLLVPYKLANTNQSFMYSTKSYCEWNGKRCVKLDNPLAIGIGGITIQTTVDSAEIIVQTKDGKGFNCIKIFHQNDESAFDLEAFDETGVPLTKQAYMKNNEDFETVFFANQLLQTVIIRHKKTMPSQWQSIIYGLYVSNGKKGVVYNSLGVNGAEYRHYNEAQYFAQQSKVLTPDLIIISLGTNEAANSKFDEEVFYNQIDKLVNDLQNYNPNAVILLTTPADNFRRKKYPNTIIKRVSKTIVNYCINHQLPYWDLYQISGGYKSARFWKKYQLLAKDNLHYSKKGYQVQGTLLYQALMKEN